MEQNEIVQAAWVLCSAWGQSAGYEADTLAQQFALMGAEPAARIWRDVARVVRTIQADDDAFVLQ